MEAPQFGIRNNYFIDAKASNFYGLSDKQGGHHSIWCDRVIKTRNCAEVRRWAHMNRKCCDKRKLGGI